ncbi:type IV pilus assembly PilZ [Desulfarculus baarsii DSM 2075]|uniref:Type IV pilus assembly PilZ n=1 Tax=Desulfarculus baarsii (strain ATCC 33931 / DSM 2075 / LMG 7858 / VKM B-1802 / 2st14) TaxID=644282 RepID=E1QGA1_DESB2|nr:flagellar brake protein [Desulfarculus baarsii]ADK83613.1 type IV pilus assembly PilZ [Desulfarculus baarsii DSM 2075]
MDIEALINETDGLTKLEIALGDRLLLRLEAIEGFLKTDLVGLAQDQYLIVDMPKGGPAIRNKFYEGTTVLVRYLHAGAIFAFQSNVLGTTDKPVKLVFLSYPQIVSRQELRREARMECYLSAAADLGQGQLINGAVLDISPSGCRFAAKFKGRPAVEIGGEVIIGMKLSDGEKARRCAGTLRSLSQSNGMAFLGVQFRDLDEDSALRIRALVATLGEYAAAKRSIAHLGQRD